MDFWQRLEDRLWEKRMSAAELARHIGISPASVNGWKNGSLYLGILVTFW